jgi:hypothetical protein
VRAAALFVPLVVVAGALALSGGAASVPRDTGLDRPPLRLTSDQKTIWMTEWVACWRVKMHALSRLFHIPVESTTTPQSAARRLAKRAEFLVYETQAELVVAVDGCRNGILWRYYHPQT